MIEIYPKKKKQKTGEMSRYKSEMCQKQAERVCSDRAYTREPNKPQTKSTEKLRE